MMEYLESFYALRGATTVDTDNSEAVDEAVKELFEALLSKNHLTEKELGFVLFSQTSDIRSRNAAAAVRKAGYCSQVPLFCVQEAEIDGMLPLCIRVLISVNHAEYNPKKMCYLRGSANLRSDLKEK